MTRFPTTLVLMGMIGVIAAFSIGAPTRTEAVGTAADAMCLPVWVYTLACGVPEVINGQPTGRVGGLNCPCKDVTSGLTTTGICLQPLKCQAISAPGLGGSGNALDQGLAQLGKMLGDIMGKLMQGQSGQGKDSGQGQQTPQSQTPLPGQQGCTSYYQSSFPTSDPCAQYTPPVSGLLGAGTDTGFGSLLGGSVNTGTSVGTGGSTSLSGSFNSLVGASPSNGTGGTGTGFIGSGHMYVMDHPYYCLTNVDPIQTTPIIAGQPFDPSLCFNDTVSATGARPYQGNEAATLTSTLPPAGSGTGVLQQTATLPLTSTNSGISVGTSIGTNIDPSNGTPLNTDALMGASVSNDLKSTTGKIFTNLFSTAGSRGGTPQEIVQAVVQGSMPAGIYGDIKLLGNGTTIVANSRDANSETVGFYGASTIGASSQGVVAQLCAARPWAKNFLSYIVPPAFFDGLCSWRGYAVGTPTPAPASAQQTIVVRTGQSTGTRVATSTASGTGTTTAPRIQAKVDIWAEPVAVPIGSRASIFWHMEGVLSCTVTSPDGSFTQNPAADACQTRPCGASTVALSHATTFTIACLDSQGTPVSKSVTVQMAI